MTDVREITRSGGMLARSEISASVMPSTIDAVWRMESARLIAGLAEVENALGGLVPAQLAQVCVRLDQAEFTPEGFATVLDINLSGVFYITQAVGGIEGVKLLSGASGDTAWHPDGQQLLIAVSLVLMLWRATAG